MRSYLLGNSGRFQGSTLEGLKMKQVYQVFEELCGRRWLRGTYLKRNEAYDRKKHLLLTARQAKVRNLAFIRIVRLGDQNV